MLRHLKKRNLKFNTFDWDLVLGLHGNRDPSESSLEKKTKELLEEEEKEDDIPFNEFFEIEDNKSD